MTLVAIADKPLKTFDELMSTPIKFSAYIMNGLNITNLTQETLLRPAFKLLKGTRTNFAELEYDFEECYKALSKKLDWDNPKDVEYLFDLTKPLPLVMNGNRQIVPVDYLFNNDLKYLQGGILTMTYTTSTTKTKATYTANVHQKHRYSKESRRSSTRSRNLPEDQRHQAKNLPQRRWSSLEKKRAHFMIKAIDKQLKERRVIRSLEKFVGGRHYETDLRLLQ
nr:hypothetical protein [Tanacetum cinerariifolium]GEZ24589.1 hypothetical protein [Tanacetum cinerariifolium]